MISGGGLLFLALSAVACVSRGEAVKVGNATVAPCGSKDAMAQSCFLPDTCYSNPPGGDCKDLADACVYLTGELATGDNESTFCCLSYGVYFSDLNACQCLDGTEGPQCAGGDDVPSPTAPFTPGPEPRTVLLMTEGTEDDWTWRIEDENVIYLEVYPPGPWTLSMALRLLGYAEQGVQGGKIKVEGDGTVVVTAPHLGVVAHSPKMAGGGYPALADVVKACTSARMELIETSTIPPPSPQPSPIVTSPSPSPGTSPIVTSPSPSASGGASTSPKPRPGGEKNGKMSTGVIAAIAAGGVAAVVGAAVAATLIIRKRRESSTTAYQPM